MDLPEKSNPKASVGIPGRGSSLRGDGRFERIQQITDWEQVNDPELADELNRKVPTEYLTDASESIVSRNNSPDVDFNYSLNPYRGCVHGCSYCYARPSHEYLGFNAGLDFETKIIVKHEAPALFQKWLGHRGGRSQVEPVMLSGVTDCYQPCEKQFELTRQLLRIALESRQPMRITTKNAMVKRDIDLLSEMAEYNLTCVTISLASLDQSLTRIMEPRSSSPQARLNAIEELTRAGVPVKVLTAPLIPSINDQEIPKLLEHASQAGATFAGYVMLRLPLSVEPVFFEWLNRHFPDRTDKIIGRLESLGNGQLYDSTFKSRMQGQGIWADQTRQLFETYCRKFGLKPGIPILDCSLFRGFDSAGYHQKSLF